MNDHNSKEWTFDSYDTYVTQRFEDNSKAVDAALAAAKEAVLKSEKASTERANASNEIRGAMMDAQNAFASRDQLEAMNQRVRLLETTRSEAVGNKAGIGLIIAVAAGSLGAIGIITNLIMNLT